MIMKYYIKGGSEKEMQFHLNIHIQNEIWHLIKNYLVSRYDSLSSRTPNNDNNFITDILLEFSKLKINSKLNIVSSGQSTESLLEIVIDQISITISSKDSINIISLKKIKENTSILNNERIDNIINILNLLINESKGINIETYYNIEINSKEISIKEKFDSYFNFYSDDISEILKFSNFNNIQIKNNEDILDFKCIEKLGQNYPTLFTIINENIDGTKLTNELSTDYVKRDADFEKLADSLKKKLIYGEKKLLEEKEERENRDDNHFVIVIKNSINETEINYRPNATLTKAKNKNKNHIIYVNSPKILNFEKIEYFNITKQMLIEAYLAIFEQFSHLPSLEDKKYIIKLIPIGTMDFYPKEWAHITIEAIFNAFTKLETLTKKTLIEKYELELYFHDEAEYNMFKDLYDNQFDNGTVKSKIMKKKIF